MEKKKLEELDYDLELEKVVKEIKKQKSKKVLIQLPEGLKPYATQIQDELEKKLKEKKLKAEFFIWLDTCFGACDIPIETERLGVDLIVQFGHSEFRRNLLDRKNN
jgi:2-(3-amino-3-carboxypropyl)histidine synthase